MNKQSRSAILSAVGTISAIVGLLGPCATGCAAADDEAMTPQSSALEACKPATWALKKSFIELPGPTIGGWEIYAKQVDVLQLTGTIENGGETLTFSGKIAKVEQQGKGLRVTFVTGLLQRESAEGKRTAAALDVIDIDARGNVQFLFMPSGETTLKPSAFQVPAGCSAAPDAATLAQLKTAPTVQR